MSYDKLKGILIHEKFVDNKWPLWQDEDLRFLVLRLCGETGELANWVKKEWRGDSINREEMAKELADISTFVDLIAYSLSLDLDEIKGEKQLEIEERLRAKGITLGDYGR